MNIATQQYVSFLADGIAYSPYSTAAVIGFEFVLQGTTDSCGQLQPSYNCYTKAASPLTKFAWYFLPESAGSDVPATIKRSTQSYYIIVSEYLAASPTSALTGANMSAFNNNLGIALTNFDDTDPWQLFTITSV
ncbi:hypothetical protein MNV49_002003 [Pseudohyphozyma bogoriensis]|nr:hypothetical protein MNV49_002003 [Pseudohyphozyma bogoriensis]